MFCKHCGKDIDQYAKICLNCNKPTGFLKGLDGKEKIDSIAALGILGASSDLNGNAVKKFACKQCGYLNNSGSDVCSLCGCAIETPVSTAPAVVSAAPAANVVAAETQAQEGESVIASLFLPQNRKKLIIGAAVIAEALLLLLVIIIVILFSGKSRSVTGTNSGASLVYLNSSSAPVSSENVLSTQSAQQVIVSSGLDINALIDSEGNMSSSSLLSSPVSSAASTPAYIIIPPGGYTSQTTVSQTSSQSSSTTTVPSSSEQSSSYQSSQSSSAPSSSSQSSSTSSKDTSSKTSSQSVSSTQSSKPSSSKPVSSKPVSSEPESQVSSSVQSAPIQSVPNDNSNPLVIPD